MCVDVWAPARSCVREGVMYVCVCARTSSLPGPVGGPIITSRGLLLAIVWVWCRHNPAEQLSIFGMFTVQSYQFPWVCITEGVCVCVKLMPVYKNNK